MISQWIGSAPTLFYSLFAGGLSDEAGRKPLLILPIVGQVVQAGLEIVNYTFFDSLPTEFFFVVQVNDVDKLTNDVSSGGFKQ